MRASRATIRASRSSTAPSQFGYAPGSTFKVLTATAAIDTGTFTPESTLSGRNEIPISGVPLKNDENESLGQITLTEALAKSVNTVWAQVGEKLGKRTMGRYMNRFGFNRGRSSTTRRAKCRSAARRKANGSCRPRARKSTSAASAIGQDKLEVVPLQMAEVAAAVANHGVLMVPHMTSRIVNAEGQTVQTISPRVQSVVMKPSTASSVTGMMEAVVNEGTGVSAQIPGVQVAGKTGTAETQIGHGDQQRLVHRVRARACAASGDRGDAAGRAGTGRGVRRPGCQAGDRKAAP